VIGRTLIAILGVLLVLWTGSSALRTVVLPRVNRSTLDRVVFRTLRVVFRALSRLRNTFEWRDHVMAMYSPIGLMSLVVMWLTLVATGYTLVFWAVEQRGWAEAIHTSGSSLLTLGFAPVEGTGLRLVAFLEAAMGIGLLALLITYLPALYGAFSRRETLVGTLEARAGNPPSAVEMIERFHKIGWLHRLSDVWADWEVWFADVEESHSSYPALVFYRSPQPDRHWVTAAGTVLDAAALALSSVDVDRQAQAALMIRSGYIALSRIADFFGVEYQRDPASAEVSVTRPEWEAALDRLQAAGVPLISDRDRAWHEFSTWRANYDTPLLALAEITTAPYAPWTSDRSAPGYRRVRVRSWGRRK
jgi:hypothetical protein